MTFAHGLFDGQFLSTFLAIVAWPHCVPFVAGGSGKYRPSKRMSSRQPAGEKTIWRIETETGQPVVFTFLEVAVNFERPDAGVFRFAARVHPFLFVHH